MPRKPTGGKKGPPKGYELRPMSDRLWEKIPSSLPVDVCWPWSGMRVIKPWPNADYGILKVKGRRRYAHRLVWELLHGPIPEGKFICHHCDNPPCCNPKHLFLGTPRENTLDMYGKGRDALTKGTRYQPNVSGASNGRARISLEEVTQIRLAGRTRPIKEIAEQYGVHTTTINNILSGRTWKIAS